MTPSQIFKSDSDSKVMKIFSSDSDLSQVALAPMTLTRTQVIKKMTSPELWLTPEIGIRDMRLESFIFGIRESPIF
ncbi:unnamed protein product [Brachionus calyciflorus]|uniref:Uncharacterized protein n=1 Tax=Brachionus calyciflorus TaxID=104777 RepID=A0A813ZE18_9BILA|nr:unnamed protein product [Brachionus calyciflorus]